MSIDLSEVVQRDRDNGWSLDADGDMVQITPAGDEVRRVTYDQAMSGNAPDWTRWMLLRFMLV